MLILSLNYSYYGLTNLISLLWSLNRRELIIFTIRKTGFNRIIDWLKMKRVVLRLWTVVKQFWIIINQRVFKCIFTIVNSSRIPSFGSGKQALNDYSSILLWYLIMWRLIKPQILGWVQKDWQVWVIKSLFSLPLRIFFLTWRSIASVLFVKSLFNITSLELHFSLFLQNIP